MELTIIGGPNSVSSYLNSWINVPKEVPDSRQSNDEMWASTVVRNIELIRLTPRQLRLNKRQLKKTMKLRPYAFSKQEFFNCYPVNVDEAAAGLKKLTGKEVIAPYKSPPSFIFLTDFIEPFHL